ncbi:MAG: hypothetical protein HGA30_04985, partial [Anaerolineales bacterium]|nr:hypothetical protein [Anaerolineales bacterium]
NDDWYLMYSAGTYGPGAFTDIFSVDRPARALVMIPAYGLFGETPFYYNLSAYVFRLLSAFAFFWLLNILWPRQNALVFGASLLYLIYPGFLSQHNGIDYQSQMVSLAAALFSLALSVKAAVMERGWRRFALFTLSTLFGWLYLGLVEYFIGFELFRWGCVFLLSSRTGGTLARKAWQTVRLAYPSLAVPGVFLIWRLFFFQSERGATDVDLQFEQVMSRPVQTVYHWIIQVFQDLFDVMVSAWVIPLSQLRDFIQQWGVVIAVLAAVAVFFAIRKLEGGERLGEAGQAKVTREALWLGLLVAVGGLIPVVMVNREVAFPSFSRYSLASSAGVAIFLSGLLLALKWRTLRNGLFALLVFVSVVVHTANNMKAVIQTASIRNFWWQVSWRVPHLGKNTTLIAQYPGVPIEEDYFVWGPANLIYYPEKQNEKNIQPGVYAALLNTSTIEKVKAGERQEYNKRKTITTYANYRNILVLAQAGENSCVHVLDGTRPEYSNGEWDFIREVGPYSEIEHVLTEETPHTPPTIAFGPEPDRGWCYYYQKADLARQRGAWGQVLEIGGQAFGQGLEPRDLIEWMPFLQAYAVSGDAARLAELAPVIGADPYIAGQACQILDAMPSLSSPVKEVVTAHYCVGQ